MLSARWHLGSTFHMSSQLTVPSLGPGCTIMCLSCHLHICKMVFAWQFRPD